MSKVGQEKELVRRFKKSIFVILKTHSFPFIRLNSFGRAWDIMRLGLLR